jgi:hypothetical protein
MDLHRSSFPSFEIAHAVGEHENSQTRPPRARAGILARPSVRFHAHSRARTRLDRRAEAGNISSAWSDER